MTPALLARLDALWAAHLHCQPADLRSQNTLIIDDPTRRGAIVCLRNGSCVITAAPALAPTLRLSVGTRTPAQAFEPGRLREAMADFNLTLSGPNAVLVAMPKGEVQDRVCWVKPGLPEDQLQSAIAASDGIPMISIPMRLRTDRLVADQCGFRLYAGVIHLGEITYP
jgi:hypothetical protein